MAENLLLCTFVWKICYFHATFGYSHSFRSQGTVFHDTLCAHTHINNVTTFNWQCTMAPNGHRQDESTSRQIFIVTLCVFNGCLCKCLRETHWFKWTNLCDLFLRPITELNKRKLSLFPQEHCWSTHTHTHTHKHIHTQTHTHTQTHPTCYTGYSCHDNPQVRTPLFILEEDAKDIRMGLKEPVLSTQPGFIWLWMWIENWCKHFSEPSRSTK